MLLACTLSSCARIESAKEAREEAPFRLSNAGQLDAHLGKRVEVEGTADSDKDGAYVTATSFYSFQLNGVFRWPTGVAGKKVLVTGKLVLNPGLSEAEFAKVQMNQTRGPQGHYVAGIMQKRGVGIELLPVRREDLQIAGQVSDHVAE